MADARASVEVTVTTNIVSADRLKALRNLEESVGVFLRLTAGQLRPEGAAAWAELHGSYITSRETK